MKRHFTSLLFLIILSVGALAQQVEGSLVIKAREDMLRKLPTEAAYFMPDFRDATVQFNDGRLSQGRINICLVDNSVRFVDETGDTLLLSNAADVMRIIIGDTVMLQRDGYFIKALTVYGQTFLGEHRSLSLEEAEIDAGYSSIPATSMAKRANVVTIDPDRMREGEKTVYYRLSVRYVIGNGISIYPARLSSFIKLFPDKKKELRRYARERRIDFGDKMDLIDFFYYCTSQPSIRREAVEKVTSIRMTFLPSAWNGRQ